jgi:branched-chain amino acid transport system substrate-binding protein
MKKRLFSLVLLILIGTGGMLSGCGAVQEEPVRIGLIAYLQGDGITIESSGQPTLNGAELAVQQINEGGGLRVAGRQHPVELVVIPIENGVANAVDAARSLIIERGVVAIVGPQYSGDAIAAAQIAEDAGIPLLSGTSTNPRTTENRRFIFRMAFTDTFQAETLAKLAYEDLRARRVAVLYDSTDTYSHDLGLFFGATFANLGGEVVVSESFESGNWNMDAQFKRILDANPDLVFLPVYPAEAIYQAGSLRKMGYNGILLGGDGWNPPSLVNLPAFEGSYASTTYSEKVTTPQNQVFVRAYLDAYNVSPVDAAGLTYDALQMIFAAIEMQGSFDPLAIRDGLYSLPQYVGVSGPIDFVTNGDPVKPLNILFFEAGEVKFYKAIQPER